MFGICGCATHRTAELDFHKINYICIDSAKSIDDAQTKIISRQGGGVAWPLLEATNLLAELQIAATTMTRYYDQLVQDRRYIHL